MITPKPVFRFFQSPFACFATCLILLLLLARPVAATPKGKPCGVISGTVWGPDDRAVPEILVKIRGVQNKKAHWEIYTNHRGEFWQPVWACSVDYVISADTKSYKLPDGKRLQPSPEVTVHVEVQEHAETGLHLK